MLGVETIFCQRFTIFYNHKQQLYIRSNLSFGYRQNQPHALINYYYYNILCFEQLCTSICVCYFAVMDCIEIEKYKLSLGY